jgi:hypothetical protein
VIAGAWRVFLSPKRVLWGLMTRPLTLPSATDVSQEFNTARVRRCRKSRGLPFLIVGIGAPVVRHWRKEPDLCERNDRTNVAVSPYLVESTIPSVESVNAMRYDCRSDFSLWAICAP